MFLMQGGVSGRSSIALSFRFDETAMMGFEIVVSPES